MIHHRNRLFALLLTLVLASSCCKNEYPEGGEVPPLWSTNLVLGSFQFVDKNGETEDLIIAIRNDNDNHAWLIDGGI